MTRRRWLRGVGALAGTGLLAEGAPAVRAAGGDGELVLKLLSVELLTIAVQERVLASGHLTLGAAVLVRRVLAQERRHAVILSGELRRLGGAAPAPPTSTDDIERQLLVHHVTRSLHDLPDEHRCLDLLLSMEGVTEGACYGAMSKLVTPRLQALTARLLAAEAQHEAVLGALRNPKDADRSLPYPFVEGFN